jgi:hypothetical protein
MGGVSMLFISIMDFLRLVSADELAGELSAVFYCIMAMVEIFKTLFSFYCYTGKIS